MSSSDLANIIDKTVLVFSILIIARALVSWFPNVDPRNPIIEFLYTVTEPILAPIRSIMPRMGMIDLTPLIAIIVLQLIGRFLVAGLA